MTKRLLVGVREKSRVSLSFRGNFEVWQNRLSTVKCGEEAIMKRVGRVKTGEEPN